MRRRLSWSVDFSDCCQPVDKIMSTNLIGVAPSTSVSDYGLNGDHQTAGQEDDGQHLRGRVPGRQGKLLHELPQGVQSGCF